MNTAETLMLTGVEGHCPDCHDERILVEVAPLEFCCTTCDAAVLVPNVLRGAPLEEGRRAS